MAVPSSEGSMGMASCPRSPRSGEGSGVPDCSHPFPCSTFTRTHSASALPFPPSLPFRAFPAGWRRLLIPGMSWLQRLMLFRRAPTPMLLFTRRCDRLSVYKWLF